MEESKQKLTDKYKRYYEKHKEEIALKKKSM
jgi:hypothetical protein